MGHVASADSADERHAARLRDRAAADAARRRRRLLLGALCLFVLYVFNAIGHYLPQYLHLVSWITVPSDGREGLIEVIEAALWFTAFVMFAIMAVRAYRAEGVGARLFWLVLFAGLSFTVLGEEISWGQHFGLFEPSEAMKSINDQEEFNFHNLNVAKMLELPPEHALFPYLENIGSLVSPAFQLFCVGAWVIGPWLIRKTALARTRLFGAYPMPAVATSLFVLGNYLAYIVVDKTLYDVAELLELGTGLGTVFVCLDLMTRER